ncbi:sulfatase-like hydrolase/transferase [Bradyrhizobium sp. LHD-71]|uniref:sulfatase-like hydrolase/transferase n=1 Tax=Bradyrhizobium sp. LHD-71 TaxID=3072141 RepID=UPI00280C6013|nr:sulfatase-like hydrolase/transferase [Bradyrhizobium sp. LHD-71]MDQ8727872.1 sulfatase-like hydrolase/transferase [Bradyrhizobium sp. LHD-71]
MAPSPLLRPAKAVAIAIGSAKAEPWRAALIGTLYAACVFVLYRTEYGPFATSLSLLTLLFTASLGMALFRRPGIAAALSLIVFSVLIALSRLKFDVTQLTLTFLDLLLIDRDTFSFLVTTHPWLKWQIALGTMLVLPLLWLVFRLDPFRIRRRAAFAGAGISLLGMIGLSVPNPEQPWEPFQGVNHISNLARSGVAAVSHLAAHGWMEAEPKSLVRAAYAAAPTEECDVTQRRPHIILLLDESSFDISAAPGIKVPEGYSDFFQSADGKTRTFVAEATGGPTWYTEFNVLMGLSARSFGKMQYYVTRIAAGHISRGLPQSLKRCGYRTFSLYPSYGNFLNARKFQHSAGVGGFVDAADMKAADEQQPDTFYFDQALRLIARERPKGAPLFTFVYLAANHFPWTTTFRPDLTPDWRGPGNTAEVDEYIRRQAMTKEAYENFVTALKARYPEDEFLIVRFGDHQPAISQKLLEPDLAPGELGKRVMKYDPRYFSTYYALDGINYRPKNLASAPATLDAAYLPIVVQEAAGVPLDPTFAEQKRIMLRCNGVFYACRDGAEARRFNRLLMDAGLIKGL